jgi:U4/U6 small nuclear ribonucleoprotein PRP4
MTWKLWDVEQGKELLDQEGHSRSVYAIAFQGDGSLVSTGGEDCIGRVWDLRSGKSIYVLRGHSKQILGMDFAPNGYQIASCSEDNTVRIWDLRKRRCMHTVPAHSSTISHVKYHPTQDLLISGSFDHTVKLWSTIDWSPVKSLTTEGKIMGVDISLDCKYIATANYDRTWRLFSHDPLL